MTRRKKVRFAELLEHHQREIYRYVFRMSGDADDASDLMQDTFLRAFQAFPKLPPDANHRAWLYKIAHHQTLNLFRSRKRRATEPIETTPESRLERASDGPDSVTESKRLAGVLAEAIRNLTPRQRSALLLKKYEGLGYPEVAEVLRMSQDNARAQVHQAMKKVRAALRSEDER